MCGVLWCGTTSIHTKYRLKVVSMNMKHTLELKRIDVYLVRHCYHLSIYCCTVRYCSVNSHDSMIDSQFG